MAGVEVLFGMLAEHLGDLRLLVKANISSIFSRRSL
ncbi:unnamed protein product [Enterobius vermicularis]|uniref:Transposase n=1 Tax=Enterobius vermicularis TaxID=51028 RepID=A0A0N4V298_ENTVE|nr:unnamed protein product [Enterobius vermicularis]